MTARATPDIERVAFPSVAAAGGVIDGELRSAGGAAVVLVADVHGISRLHRSRGERLAAAGFNTLVLDVYAHKGFPHLPDRKQAGDWIAALPDERVLGDLEAGRTRLSRREGVRTPRHERFRAGGAPTEGTHRSGAAAPRLSRPAPGDRETAQPPSPR